MPIVLGRVGREGVTASTQPAKPHREPPAAEGARRRFTPPFPPIEAKLHPPAHRPGTIPRPRLIRLLSAKTRPPIVSIVAPPGYGKTVLLAEWSGRARRPVAWLTVDDLDNDPTVFLTYVALALDRIEPVDPSLRAAIAVPGQRILGSAVPHLAGELHRWTRPGVLVLDDVHRLTDRTCLDALSQLLDHLPPGFLVALAARMEPDLPFARYRASRRLLEIGRDELALDEEETSALATAVGQRLTDDEVRALAARTEGWATGIYLATLARDDADGRVRSVGDVSGRDHYIAGYLRAELRLERSEEDATLLTRTSILETVEPEVADAVTGRSGAAERLPSIARANLLVSEIHAPIVSYRYHQLLREFLQAELERREPGSASELHRRAASWYLAAGRLERAVEHSIAGGDVDAAARLVTAAALPTLYGGHGATLDRWLRGFDEAVFMRQPPLAIIAGWIHLLNGRAESTDRMLDIAERSKFSGSSEDGSSSFASLLAMLRAIVARRGPEDVLANARLAADAERPDSPWRANALWLLGSAHLLHGDPVAADAAFARAVDAAATAGATAMVALAKRAGLALGRGDLKAAGRFADESRTILGRADFGEIVAALIVHATGARIAIQLGDRASAREQLVRAQLVRPLASPAAPWFAVDALLELSRAYLASSDPSGARNVLREAEAIARRRPALGVLTDELAEMRRRLGDAGMTLAGSSSLTAAELRLLPILSTYLSFQDIGERLHISRNTVKTQALSIYGKLGASSRGEAVERAVELGLLEPFPGLALVRRPVED